MAKGLPWFRMYAEFATDPKVQRMSETDQRRFMMLLCIRCSNGDVTLHDEDIAFQLRISVTEWCESKRTFIERNFIDEDNNVMNWEKRQFASDSSAMRVSRHREKKKQQCNVTGNTKETKSNAVDTDTDTDKKSKPSSSNPDGFDAFWLAYPKKVGKVAALKVWKKIKPPKQTAESMLASLAWQRDSEQWSRDGGQFIPNPATYLNQGRWLDEKPDPSRSSDSPKPKWFETASGIESMGEKLGVKPEKGENFQYFKERVFEAFKARKEAA